MSGKISVSKENVDLPVVSDCDYSLDLLVIEDIYYVLGDG